MWARALLETEIGSAEPAELERNRVGSCFDFGPPRRGSYFHETWTRLDASAIHTGKYYIAAKNWASKLSIQIASAGRTEKRGALAACRSSRARSDGVAAGTWARAAHRDPPLSRRNGHERGDESDAEL